MKKQFRIKKTEEIELVLKERKVVGGKHFVIYKKENHENTHFRYALSVPKKFGDAVLRNKMKRRIRAIVRSYNLINEIDFFVIAKASSNTLSFKEIKEELDYLFKKAQLLEEKND
ncbi:ribonuclease P protein component [bacterium]|nr:ribonuclease P protein component [bacterium]